MKIKVTEGKPKPKTPDASEVAAGFAALFVFLLLGGLLIWWLTPVATGHAVTVGFWQSVAIAGLIRTVKAIITAKVKPS